MANLCIYCSTEDQAQLTKSHLFAKGIGGKFYEYYSCILCNNVLGSTIESRMSESLFFTHGMAKLGVKTLEAAFKRIRAKDAQTGDSVRMQESGFVGKLSVSEDGTISGTKEDVEECLLNITKSNRPNWVDEVREQLASGAEIINIAGDRYRRIIYKGIRRIELEGESDFPTDLLAKLSFEGMYVAGLYTKESRNAFKESTFVVNGDETDRSRIEVKGTFRRRARRQHPRQIGDLDYKSIKYAPWHSLEFRLTENDTAYIKIKFFGVASFFVVIDRVPLAAIADPESLGGRYLFPLEGVSVVRQELPDELRELKRGEDVVADMIWKEFSGSLLGSGESESDAS